MNKYSCYNIFGYILSGCDHQPLSLGTRRPETTKQLLALSYQDPPINHFHSQTWRKKATQKFGFVISHMKTRPLPIVEPPRKQQKQNDYCRT